MKATAVAHPIQGLIKYHGLADPVLRLPFHDSISVCTAPLSSRTTVEFGAYARDQATIDGRDVTARDMERIRAVVDPIRTRASVDQRFRMASVNDFPSNIGLGASASGFAALAMAAAHAAGLRVSLEDLSRFARRGAGSATRSVTGGFSKWKMGLTDEDSYGVQLAGTDLELQVGYSHSVKIKPREGISFEVPVPTQVVVRGIDKQMVGQTAAEIRKVRPPEPYKGKGIRYEGEYVARKVGKRA